MFRLCLFYSFALRSHAETKNEDIAELRIPELCALRVAVAPARVHEASSTVSPAQPTSWLTIMRETEWVFWMCHSQIAHGLLEMLGTPPVSTVLTAHKLGFSHWSVDVMQKSKGPAVVCLVIWPHPCLGPSI